jgi:hypothetical protein
MSVAIVGQSPSGEFSEFGQAFRELCAVKISIEDDCMNVRRHDHKRIHAELLLLVTEAEAVRDDPTRLFTDEDWQPIDNAESDKVK